MLFSVFRGVLLLSGLGALGGGGGVVTDMCRELSCKGSLFFSRRMLVSGLFSCFGDVGPMGGFITITTISVTILVTVFIFIITISIIEISIMMIQPSTGS